MSTEKKSEEQILLEEFLTKTEKQIKELEEENKAEASVIRISLNNAMLLVHRNNLLWLTSMAEIRGINIASTKTLPF